VDSYDGVDSLLVYLPIFIAFVDRGEDPIRVQVEAIKDFKAKSRKPLIVALLSSGIPQVLQLGFELQRILVDAGIPVYPSLRRSACALSRFIKHYEKNPF